MDNNQNSEMNSLNKKVENSNKPGKKSNFMLVFLLLIIIGLGSYFIINIKYKKMIDKDNQTNNKDNTQEEASLNTIKNNSLSEFDLSFLKMENGKNNVLYSPISIKYALKMLEDGTNGNSKKQISNIIGDYKINKYINSANMAFANALFVKDTYSSNINKTFINKLSTDYGAEVIYDSFSNANNINSWIKNKTLNLIENLFDDSAVSNSDFFITNSLGIDMEWKEKIQPDNFPYEHLSSHEKFNVYVSSLKSGSGYKLLDFNESGKVKSVEFAAAINNYDIIKELGEENIREFVQKKYEEWVAKGNTCGEENPTFSIDDYIKELASNYGKYSSSTDFLMYIDDNVKAFAKDLKEYNGITLQYVGIMPIDTDIEAYINNLNIDKLNNITSNLKEIKPENFKQGVATKITGILPLFNFEYDLDLYNDLKRMSVTDVFDNRKADLSNLTLQKNAYLNTVKHKANIEFSNDGIKASAATTVGGLGAGSCGFNYIYDIPVEEIDLTFDKPYLFMIRNKNTNEIWFMGKVYNPVKCKTFFYDACID